MPPKRGRPPKAKSVPTSETSPELSPESRAFEALYPPDLSKVACVLCQQEVEEIEPHLKRDHPTVRLEDYALQFPSAPVKGDPLPESRRVIKVSAAEAAAHPGGREGAVIEKMLDRSEREAYREDIQSILSEGHRVSRAVASVAHYMVLARRSRAILEKVRDKTDGTLFASDHLDILHDLEEKIGKGMQNLEKLRTSRAQEAGEDPLAVVSAELEAAERWVQEHIGEHVERCPGCGMMLTAPALPHWAYEPMMTEHGMHWPVWSTELWTMVNDRIIPLWVMAFTLRTSPEGLKYTARKRQQAWPDWIDVDEEERLLRVQLDKQDREIKAPLVALPRTTERTEGEDDE